MRPFDSPARRRGLQALAAGIALCANLSWLGAAQAADPYPNKPVKIVVGFAPGGTNDVLARLVSVKLQDRLKQAFVVDNKPGANSALGADFVAKSKGDGYTLLVSSSGGLTVNPVLMKSVRYDPVKDFEPIALLGTFPLVVTVPAALPVRNLPELVRYGKSEKAGSLDHGVASSSFQLVAETLASAFGISFNQVNYRGSGPVVQALLGQEVQVGVVDAAVVTSHIKAGTLRALAVTTGARSAAFPDVPTVAESGFPGYDAPIWTALMAPKGTPPEILAVLRTTVKEILAEPDTVSRLAALGVNAGDADSAALSKRIASDLVRWERVAAAAHIKPE